MKQLSNNFILWVLIFSLTGCVTIFGKKRQNVKITSVTPQVEISIDNRSIPSNMHKPKVEKNQPHSLEASKEGYKSRRGVISPEKGTFLVLADLAFAPFGWGIFALVCDFLFSPIKMSRYKSKFEFAPLKPLPQKATEEKYIWVQDVIVNIKKGDVLGKFFTSFRKMKRDKSFTEYKSDEKILYDIPVFKHDMNEILLSYGYSDTSENVIASSWNSLYLTSEIKTLNTSIAQLKVIRGNTPNIIFDIELNVEWVLYDGFGNEILKTSTNGRSDSQLSPIDFDELKFKQSVKDAIEYAMIELHENTNFKELLIFDSELASGAKNPQTNVAVDIPSSNSENVELPDQMNSIVRVSAGERSYSGTVLSNDGYIVTSYQAISSGDEVKVKIDSNFINAEIISTNAQLNLVLLKIESDNIDPINWIKAEAPNIGERVYTLSFSSLEMLDKYVSSGIISGFRSFQSKPYIQSDVPMSFGNSGGVMLNENGHLIGILNSKANSEGVEGIGFAVPIQDVLDGLNIVLK